MVQRKKGAASKSAAVYEVKKGDRVICKTTEKFKRFLCVPAKNAKRHSEKPAPSKALENLKGREKEIYKRAEAYVRHRTNVNATRRALAKKVTIDDEGRRIYFKVKSNQNEASMTRVKAKKSSLQTKKQRAETVRDRKAMMKKVREIRRKRDAAQRVAMIKAKNPNAVIMPKKKPLPPVLYLGKYAPPAKAQKVVLLTNLPEKVTVEQVASALDKFKHVIKKVFEPFVVTRKVVQKGEKAQVKEGRIRVLMKGELHARNLVRKMRGKLKVGKRRALFRLETQKRRPLTEKEAAAHKAAQKRREIKRLKDRMERRKKRAEIREKEKRQSKSRYHPKHWSKKILRNKHGEVYKILRNPKAKNFTLERKRLRGYKALKAMPRLTRK